MRIKNYMIPVVITALAVSILVSGGHPKEYIDAITRPSDNTATILLKGIKNVVVKDYFNHFGSSPDYKDFSKIDWSRDIESLLQQSGLKTANYHEADGLILLNIELATNKETELAAVNLRLSFVETLKIKRATPKYYFTGARLYNCTTWQASKTLLIHGNDLKTEVQKHVRNMVGNFCRIYIIANGI
jgi:hypothetical protein